MEKYFLTDENLFNALNILQDVLKLNNDIDWYQLYLRK